MQTLDRKADTRNKIQMGGLVKKAGLEDLHKSNPAALLGALIEIKNKIDNVINIDNTNNTKGDIDSKKYNDNSKNNIIKEYEEIGKKAFD